MRIEEAYRSRLPSRPSIGSAIMTGLASGLAILSITFAAVILILGIATGNKKEKEMGWASGSSLMSEVITALKGEATDKGRKRVYEHLIPEFVGMDCDTLDECRGEDEMYDEALDEWQKERGR